MNIGILILLLLAFFFLSFTKTGKINIIQAFIEFHLLIICAMLVSKVSLPFLPIFFLCVFVIGGYQFYLYIKSNKNTRAEQTNPLKFRDLFSKKSIPQVLMVLVMIGSYYWLLSLTDWQGLAYVENNYFSVVYSNNPLISFYYELFLITNSTTILSEVLAPFYIIITALCYNNIIGRTSSRNKSYNLAISIVVILFLTQQSTLTTFYLNIWIPEALLLFTVFPVLQFLYKNQKLQFYALVATFCLISKYTVAVAVIPILLSCIKNKKIEKDQLITLTIFAVILLVSYKFMPIDYYTNFMNVIMLNNPTGQFDSAFFRLAIITTPAVFCFILDVAKDRKNIYKYPVLIGFILLTIPRILGITHKIMFSLGGTYYLLMSLTILCYTCFIAIDKSVEWLANRPMKEKLIITTVSCYVLYQFQQIYR